MMTRLATLMVALVALPLTAWGIPPLQSCFRDTECPGKELCLKGQCMVPDTPPEPCGTSGGGGGQDGSGSDGGSTGGDTGSDGGSIDGCNGAFECVDGYCKHVGVHCVSDAGQCYFENGYYGCLCGEDGSGGGDGGTSGSDEPQLSDEELYEACLEELSYCEEGGAEGSEGSEGGGTGGSGGDECADGYEASSEGCQMACEDAICTDGGCDAVDPDGTMVAACVAECEACLDSGGGVEGAEGTDGGTDDGELDSTDAADAGQDSTDSADGGTGGDGATDANDGATDGQQTDGATDGATDGQQTDATDGGQTDGTSPTNSTADGSCSSGGGPGAALPMFALLALLFLGTRMARSRT